MSALTSEQRAQKAQDDMEMHERLRAAILTDRVQFFTDARMLDYQGSPVHNPWDHLGPLLVLMLLALVVLLSMGVALGIVAMTLCVLIHFLGTRHVVSWVVRGRAKKYMLESVGQWNQLWYLGGIALVMPDSTEPPCLAPRSDWRRFVHRNLNDDVRLPPAAAEPEEPTPDIAPITPPMSEEDSAS